MKKHILNNKRGNTLISLVLILIIISLGIISIAYASNNNSLNNISSQSGINQSFELSEKISPEINIKNAKDNLISSQIRIFDNENNVVLEITSNKNTLKSLSSESTSPERSEEGTIDKGEYNIEIIPENSPVKKIILNNVSLNNDVVELGIDDVPETISAPVGNWQEVYAIDPTQINFSYAVVSVVAKGNQIYKCSEWDFSNQECAGEWIFFKSVTPGEEYTFTLTPDDPGFGEIIAINAVHLDSDYNFISNIYDDVKAKDGIWSEPVYEGEIVRVTFERNLTNKNYIDVYVKSNRTIAYFDVYEAGTNNLVGRSGITEYPELQYITLKNLEHPTDTFDFKVVKFYYEEEDNSTNIDPNINSFIQFDYIHDDIINLTQADGLVAYSESGVYAPRYRIWNESNDFGAELVDAGTLDGLVTWTVTRGCHERDEIIVGTEDDSLSVNVQIYTNEIGWHDSLKVSSSIENSAYRAFDISYEDISGDALIVYENSNDPGNNDVAYRIWNGTGYSNEIILDTNMSNGEVYWVELIPKRGTDDIMLLVHNNINNLYAVPWNGTDFDASKGVLLSNSTTSNIEQNFAFAWEESSGEGLAAFDEGNNITFWEYSPGAPHWLFSETIDLGENLDGVRMCSDPTSDYIGIIAQDYGNDVHVRIWETNQIRNSYPGEDAETESNGYYNANFDCAWDKGGETVLFAYVDYNSLNMSYFNFTKATNSWSVANINEALTSVNFASDDIKSLRFVEHPTTNEIMVVAIDLLEDVSAIRWNGSSFVNITASPIEGTTQGLNGRQEEAMFDWFRYDPVPAVINVTPAGGTSFGLSETINITANVTDNINVSSVLANITLPNSTVQQLTLLDDNGDNIYNATFNKTSSFGTYTVRIIANDTSRHNNINSSETTYFSITGTNYPNVTSLLPTINSEFNVSNIIEISANVSDATGIDSVYANVSYPNGSLTKLVLTNGTGYDNKFNVSFTAPALTGNYNVSFFANNTNGNVNNTEKTNFTVSDVVNPSVSGVLPGSGSVFNSSSIIEIAANVTDDVSVDKVFANVTWPNGTISRLELISQENNKFNTSFVIPNVLGTYNITFIANDTSSNINNTQITNFTVSCNNLTILSLGCYPSDANLSQIIQCNATATDETGVDSVKANVTLPNGTAIEQAVNNVGSNYYFDFSNSIIIGRFNVSWLVNDTDGNTEEATDFFNVSDRTSPQITLNNPVYNLNTSNTTLVFNFTAADNYDSSLNCSIILDGAANQTNSTTQNGTDTLFSISGLASGAHDWNISCADSSGNSNSSETLSFAVDLDNPNFISLTTSPNSEDELDPNVNIEATANVTDNTTAVDTVILQFKLSNETDYTNITMNFNDSSGFYNATFNASSSGVYNLRLFANDSAGNSDFSNLVNITVEFERTWTRSPSEFSPVSSNLNADVSLGNLTINNTGDFELNFTITSDSGNTLFNETENFTLAANSVKTIMVNDTATLAGVKTVTLNISAANGNPRHQTATGRIIVAPGQPVLVSTFTIPSEDSLTVTQGDTGVRFSTKVENIGEGDAFNVTLFQIIPNDWIITQGETNISFNELLSGESEENVLIVSIPSGAITGSNIIKVNATGVNASGADLGTTGLLFGSSINVTVQSQTQQLGGGGTGDNLGEENPPSTGGGGGGPSLKKSTISRELIETNETIEVLRGKKIIFPLKITNIYSNALLTDVKLELDGYLSQYFSYYPLILNDIKPNRYKDFTVTLKVPPYKEKEEIELTFIITGKAIIEEVTEINGVKHINKTTKDIVEKRKVKLIIREVSEETAIDVLKLAEQARDELVDANISSNRINALLVNIQQALDEKDYEKAKKLSDEVLSLKKTLLETNLLIKNIKAKIKDAEKKGLDVSETKKILALATAAFEREDYGLALKRARQAELIGFFEVKGAFNIINFVIRFWWALLLALSSIVFISIFTYRKVAIGIVDKKVNDLTKEYIIINNFMKELQEKAFKEKTLSLSSYYKKMYNYEKRLAEIKNLQSKLRIKRIKINKPKGLLEKLKQENEIVKGMIKEVQTDYFVKKSIGKNKYKSVMNELSIRISEIEETMAIVKTKLAKETIKPFQHDKSRKWKGIHINLKGRMGTEPAMVDNLRVIQNLFKEIKKEIRLGKKAEAENTYNKMQGVYKLLDKKSKKKVYSKCIKIRGKINNMHEIVSAEPSYIVSRHHTVHHFSRLTPFIVLILVAVCGMFIVENQNLFGPTGKAVSNETNISDVSLSNEQNIDISYETANDSLTRAEQDIKEMEISGLGTFYVKDIYLEAKKAFNGKKTKENYALAIEKSDLIRKTKERAYKLLDDLELLGLKIDELSNTSINLSDAVISFNLAKQEFNDERYTKAEEFINEAYLKIDDAVAESSRLNAMLRSSKRNIKYFVRNNFLEIIITLVILLVIGLIWHNEAAIKKCYKKIKDFETENAVLLNLIKKAQADYYQNRKLSKSLFDIRVNKYQDRLLMIKEKKPIIQSHLKKSMKKRRLYFIGLKKGSTIEDKS